MDVNPGGVVAVVLEFALLAIFWVRLRAYEARVGEQSALRVDATRRAIDMMDERRSEPTDDGATRRRGRRRRKGKKRG